MENLLLEFICVCYGHRCSPVIPPPWYSFAWQLRETDSCISETWSSSLKLHRGRGFLEEEHGAEQYLPHFWQLAHSVSELKLDAHVALSTDKIWNSKNFPLSGPNYMLNPSPRDRLKARTASLKKKKKATGHICNLGQNCNAQEVGLALFYWYK